MSEYAWGVITPFIALGGLALAVAVAWLLVALARHIWAKTHWALMTTVKLPKNPYRLRLKGDPEDDRPEYIVAANKFRDALLESPKLHTFAGLGWRLILVRDSRSEGTAYDPADDVADEAAA